MSRLSDQPHPERLGISHGNVTLMIDSASSLDVSGMRIIYPELADNIALLADLAVDNGADPDSPVIQLARDWARKLKG